MPPFFRPQYFQSLYHSCDLSRPWDLKFSTWRLIFAFATLVFLESRVTNSSSPTSLMAHCSTNNRSKSEQYSLFLALDSCLIHIQISYHRNQRCIIFLPGYYSCGSHKCQCGLIHWFHWLYIPNINCQSNSNMRLDGPMAQDTEDLCWYIYCILSVRISNLHFLRRLHTYALRQTQTLTITATFDRKTQPCPSTVVILRTLLCSHWTCPCCSNSWSSTRTRSRSKPRKY